jgi:arsenate reductase
VPDPAAVHGTPQEIERAYAQAFATLDRRISLLLSLPLAALDSLAIQQHLDSIGHQ